MLKKARLSDVEEISLFIRNVISSANYKNYSSSQIEFWLSQNTSEKVREFLKKGNSCFLLEDFGVCAWNKVISRITGFYVSPEFQRKGFGTQLMSKVCDELETENSKLVVQAALGTEGFYEKNGFEGFGLDEIRSGDIIFPYRKMVKELFLH
ncbi:MAG: GNAT family N-acetyltransferase [Candidatus Pacearchaeota archaeon]|jgi:GNAT superfamily N-acetyltransferase